MRAATFAIGYPVAFDARAEERLTRGFTSMTAYSLESGCRAYWTLQPPSMPSAPMMFWALERSIWWSLSESVWLGATTMESPVCTPTGSKFSMLQTMMQLPALSRMTSYSISFQPEMHFSMSTWPTRERASPFGAISSSSPSFIAMPPPVPPRV